MKLFNFGQSDAQAASHTSGFADAADGSAPSFGAVSPESFEQRKHTDRNRQHIGNFRHAQIHRDYRVPIQRAPFSRAETPPGRIDSKTSSPIKNNIKPSHGFRELPSRHNPFS
jgi:hypothetical protein